MRQVLAIRRMTKGIAFRGSCLRRLSYLQRIKRTIALITKYTNKQVKALVSALILAFLCLYNYQLTIIVYLQMPKFHLNQQPLIISFDSEMGCTESDTLQREGLKSQLSRVKFACDIRKQRVSDELKKNEKQLSLELIKPQHSRSVAVQKAMIQGNSRLLRESLIYFFLQNETKIVLERAGLLHNLQDLNRAKQSLNSLIYASIFMSFEELQKFAFSFRRQFPDYPEPKDSDIDNQLLRGIKNNEISKKTQLEYIFQYSLNHGITMEHINSVGHNYKYGDLQE